MKLEKSKLVLGSAQWGMHYGVKNNRSQTSSTRVGEILDYAYQSGVNLIDTARSYGDAEDKIGKLGSSFFNVITKLQPLGHISSASDLYASLEDSFNSSLASLGVSSLYGLLVHDFNDLLSPCGHLIFDYLEELKSKGLLIKSGVSIYTPNQLDFILANFKPDIVQLPFNVFDQRMKRTGGIDKLNDLGIEVHARSIFLQGLLLMSTDTFPSYFSPWSTELDNWLSFCRSNNVSQLCAALSFVANSTSVDKIVVGVDSAIELSELLAIECPLFDFSMFNYNHSLDFIDPTNWKI